MLHTFVGDDAEEARRIAAAPLRRYLQSALTLEYRAARAGGCVSGNRAIPTSEVSTEGTDELVEVALTRYLRGASLIGSVESCIRTVRTLADIGVNEIACLIDFGIDDDSVLASLERVDALRASCADWANDTSGAECTAFLEAIDD
jgi:alkanesulfonate monooxygenase SsuD/methylene tetrahydromethanopterin reductase-like flavin-dependent oxidoreductase (luciferase family)